MSGAVSFVVTGVKGISFYTQKFVQSLKTQEQTFRVLYLFENFLGLLRQQASFLGISRLAGKLQHANGVLGSATKSLVLTKLPVSLYNLKDSFHKDKNNELDSEKVGYNVATLVEDFAYATLFLNTTTLVHLASKTLNSLLFVANSAAFIYDVIDFKNSLISWFEVDAKAAVNKKHASGAEKKLYQEKKRLEMLKVAKTILHLTIDIIGALAALFGVTLLSTTSLLAIICLYLVGSIWAHVYGDVLQEKQLSLQIS